MINFAPFFNLKIKCKTNTVIVRRNGINAGNILKLSYIFPSNNKTKDL